MRVRPERERDAAPDRPVQFHHAGQEAVEPAPPVGAERCPIFRGDGAYEMLYFTELESMTSMIPGAEVIQSSYEMLHFTELESMSL